MKTIWKYVMTGNAISMPEGATVLYGAMQDKEFCIWAMVDTEQPVCSRTFDVVRTGQFVPSKMRYVSTYMDGSFVWHIMEIM